MQNVTRVLVGVRRLKIRDMATTDRQQTRTGARPEYSVCGAIAPSHDECLSASLYLGVWWLRPIGVQGQSPWSGVRGEDPLKLKAI